MAEEILLWHFGALFPFLPFLADHSVSSGLLRPISLPDGDPIRLLRTKRWIVIGTVKSQVLLTRHAVFEFSMDEKLCNA